MIGIHLFTYRKEFLRQFCAGEYSTKTDVLPQEEIKASDVLENVTEGRRMVRLIRSPSPTSCNDEEKYADMDVSSRRNQMSKGKSSNFSVRSVVSESSSLSSISRVPKKKLKMVKKANAHKFSNRHRTSSLSSLSSNTTALSLMEETRRVKRRSQRRRHVRKKTPRSISGESLNSGMQSSNKNEIDKLLAEVAEYTKPGLNISQDTEQLFQSNKTHDTICSNQASKKDRDVQHPWTKTLKTLMANTRRRPSNSSHSESGSSLSDNSVKERRGCTVETSTVNTKPLPENSKSVLENTEEENVVANNNNGGVVTNKHDSEDEMIDTPVRARQNENLAEQKTENSNFKKASDAKRASPKETSCEDGLLLECDEKNVSRIEVEQLGSGNISAYKGFQETRNKCEEKEIAFIKMQSNTCQKDQGETSSIKHNDKLILERTNEQQQAQNCPNVRLSQSHEKEKNDKDLETKSKVQDGSSQKAMKYQILKAGNNSNFVKRTLDMIGFYRKPILPSTDGLKTNSPNQKNNSFPSNIKRISLRNRWRFSNGDYDPAGPIKPITLSSMSRSRSRSISTRSKGERSRPRPSKRVRSRWSSRSSKSDGSVSRYDYNNRRRTSIASSSNLRRRSRTPPGHRHRSFSSSSGKYGSIVCEYAYFIPIKQIHVKWPNIVACLIYRTS